MQFYTFSKYEFWTLKALKSITFNSDKNNYNIYYLLLLINFFNKHYKGLGPSYLNL